ncbi:hydrogenase maturation protease [Ktedonosporobacter rubrisoli]|uniref:Hydrogenase maturation protease n=1 Tax=Ktedonosporobacter rubrisoli TaxID=2509675 RepID=A0A4P6K3D1_KTERU|nr:hydrogenase maturation protease [Ktedonosporobacter rubrisoli]QBD82545.1 hydrogenase maturation protease [Ktedonosporobacter rubrisoli]
MSSIAAVTSKRILIACIGNIFLGDDGFGVEVARHLMGRYPENVQVREFGIRGLDLAFTLLEDYAMLILVDAVPRGGPPGTLYLLEPDLTEATPEQGLVAGKAALDAHSMDPVKVLAYARTLGAKPIPTLLVGCEPSQFEEQDLNKLAAGLSSPVRETVAEAVKLLDELVAKLLSESASLSIDALAH